MTHESGVPAGIAPLDERILGYEHEFSTNTGKFIRIGALVLVGPASEPQVYHKDLLQRYHSQAGIEIPVDVEHSARESLLRDTDRRLTVMHDAGYFNTYGSESVGMPLVQVLGESSVYGRADAIGRERTGRLFEQYLGDDVMVQLLH